MKWCLVMVLICIFLTAKDAGHLWMCLLDTSIPSLWIILSILKLIVYFFIIELWEFFTYSGWESCIRLDYTLWISASLWLAVSFFKTNYFEFFVRQLVDVHFFRVSYCSFIFSLGWCHVSLIFRDPRNLALVSMHLEKQPPPLVFTDWLQQGKALTSQRFGAGQLVETTGGWACGAF